MPSLKDIRKRIGSVKSTQQITKAMKMVAASKLRKATEAALEARPYSGALEELFQTLVSRIDDLGDVPLVAEREEVRTAVVLVLGSDRGLCGSFNTGLFRKLERFIWEERDRFSNLETISLYTQGKKARDYFKHRGHTIGRSETDIDPTEYFAMAQSLGRDLMKQYSEGEIDRVYVAYNKFQSALTQHPTIMQLFPLATDVEDAASDAAEGEAEPERLANHEFEPTQQEIFEVLLPKYLDARLYQAFLESEAGEQGSRMTAMDSATRNAGDMIDRLTLEYNRARQAAITKELVEIVSGAEAL